MNLKVFKMNDYDWVLSGLSREETNEWYKKEYGLFDDNDDQTLEDVVEETEKKGYFDGIELLELLNKIESGKKVTCKKMYGEYFIWKTFKKTIEEHIKNNSYTEPYVICSTEY